MTTMQLLAAPAPQSPVQAQNAALAEVQSAAYDFAGGAQAMANKLRVVADTYYRPNANGVRKLDDLRDAFYVGWIARRIVNALRPEDTEAHNVPMPERFKQAMVIRDKKRSDAKGGGDDVRSALEEQYYKSAQKSWGYQLGLAGLAPAPKKRAARPAATATSVVAPNPTNVAPTTSGEATLHPAVANLPPVTEASAPHANNALDALVFAEREATVFDQFIRHNAPALANETGKEVISAMRAFMEQVHALVTKAKEREAKLAEAKEAASKKAAADKADKPVTSAKAFRARARKEEREAVAA